MNKESRIIKKLLKHDERLDRIEENMATKEDTNRITNGIDEILVIVKRLDQERIFTQEWIKRIEKEVKNNTKDIVKLKQVLKIT